MPKHTDVSKFKQASAASSLPSATGITSVRHIAHLKKYDKREGGKKDVEFQRRDKDGILLARVRKPGAVKPPFEGKQTTHKEHTDPNVREYLNDLVRGNDTRSFSSGDKVCAVLIFRFWLFHQQKNFWNYADMLRVYEILTVLCMRDTLKETKQACYSLRGSYERMQAVLELTGPGLLTIATVGDKFLHRIPVALISKAQCGFYKKRCPTKEVVAEKLSILMPKQIKRDQGQIIEEVKKTLKFVRKPVKPMIIPKSLDAHRPVAQINGMQGTFKGNAYVELNIPTRALVDIVESMDEFSSFTNGILTYAKYDVTVDPDEGVLIQLSFYTNPVGLLDEANGPAMRTYDRAFRNNLDALVMMAYAWRHTSEGDVQFDMDKVTISGMDTYTLSYKVVGGKTVWRSRVTGLSEERATDQCILMMRYMFERARHIKSVVVRMALNGANGEYTGSDDVESKAQMAMADTERRLSEGGGVGGRRGKQSKEKFLNRKEEHERITQKKQLLYQLYVNSVDIAVEILKQLTNISAKYLSATDPVMRKMLMIRINGYCKELTNVHKKILDCARRSFKDGQVLKQHYEKAGLHMNIPAYLASFESPRADPFPVSKNGYAALASIDEEDDTEDEKSPLIDTVKEAQDDADSMLGVVPTPAPKGEPQKVVPPPKPILKNVGKKVVKQPSVASQSIPEPVGGWEETKDDRGPKKQVAFDVRGIANQMATALVKDAVTKSLIKREPHYNSYLEAYKNIDAINFFAEVENFRPPSKTAPVKTDGNPFDSQARYEVFKALDEKVSKSVVPPVPFNPPFIGPIQPKYFGNKRPVYRSLPVYDGEISVPQVEGATHVVTNCDMVYVDKLTYIKSSKGYYTRTGQKLSKKVVVHHGSEYVGTSEVKGNNRYQLVWKATGESRRIVPAYQRLSAVTEARDFTWFKDMRVSLQESWSTMMTVMTLGSNKHRNQLYTHMSKTWEDIIICDFAESSLDEKLGAALTSVNQAQLLRKLSTEFMDVPVNILADTVLYHAQKRAITQKRLNATLDGCNKFLSDRNAYAEPKLLERVLLSYDDDHRMYCDEGPIQLTSSEESIDNHMKRKTCCVREKYVKADASYSSVPTEYGKFYMFEPLSEKEEKKMEKRGCRLTDVGLKFESMLEAHTTPYSTLGTIFATQSAIINHKDTGEYCKAAQRLLGTRENEVIKRERSGIMEREILRNLKRLFDNDHFKSDDELDALTEFIQRADPEYQGSGYNTQYINDEEIDIGALVLTDDDMNFCYMRACILYIHGLATLEKEGERIVDSQHCLKEYIKTIGAKVALRNGYVRDDEMCLGESKLYLDVQMKPHEAQKYKKGKLKFGRMVVSVVGQGWIDANPTVMYDGKHMMEHPTIVTPTAEGFKIEYMEETRKFSYPCGSGRRLSVRFWMRSVLSDTSLDDLTSVITEMEVQAQMGYAFINHGDDMLSAYYDPKTQTTKWCEGDIANNDSSHVDDCFRQLYLVDRYRKEEVIAAYAQCAYPVKFVNPMDPREFGYFRSRHGMRLISGSVLTTYKNCAKSSTVGLSHAFYGGDFENAAAQIGMDVTTLLGDLEDVTFLSKVMYHKDDGGIATCTDIASVLRKFGRVTGDVDGKSNVPVHKRIQEHQKGVMKGFVHEPDSAIISVMRKRHIEDDTSLGQIRRFGRSCVRSVTAALVKDEKRMVAIQSRVRSSLNEHDRGLIRHYYGDDDDDIRRGVEDYVRLIIMVDETPAYGYTIFSRFVDAAMAKRYGMAPTVVE